ncbi:hypothetical protein [Sphingobacterium paludis]|uniref:Uncharacterized protein n=1 Tax=Sphingobacterium paludis TaxID=1476465 RepID=A0A4R7D0B8_9SPHI|nr:hypothetical protein [Sphingobacterium paludis]TDS12935.1 hypothetical protein B0I21_10566 [Sphingobacterium paludis]
MNFLSEILPLSIKVVVIYAIHIPLHGTYETFRALSLTSQYVEIDLQNLI